MSEGARNDGLLSVTGQTRRQHEGSHMKRPPNEPTPTKWLSRASAAALAVGGYAASALSALAQSPTSNITDGSGTASSTPSAFPILVIAGGAYVVWRTWKDYKRQKAEAERAHYRSKREAVLMDFADGLKAKYPHILFSEDHDRALCMMGDGLELRFIDFDANTTEAWATHEQVVEIGKVISVELTNHFDRRTESATVEKKRGAIKRAVVGDLLFGGVGAIVGSTSAGSISTTTAREHQTYLYSELTFGLNDLETPVIRFTTDNPGEADRWVHRVRAAVARATA